MHISKWEYKLINANTQNDIVLLMAQYKSYSLAGGGNIGINIWKANIDRMPIVHIKFRSFNI